MNWHLSNLGDRAINLDHVKMIMGDHGEGWWAYFSVPTDGESWETCERVMISRDDADEIMGGLFPDE